MTKVKFFGLVVLLAVFAAGGLFAQEAEGAKDAKKNAVKLSLGGGLLFSNDFYGGAHCLDVNDDNTYTYLPYSDFGGFVFFDARYVEVSLGFAYANGTMENSYFSSGTLVQSDTGYSMFNIHLSLLGKYPFTVSQKFSWFPLLGIDYIIANDPSTKDGSLDIDLNTLWFNAGAGADFSLTSKLYLRAEILFGLGLPNKGGKDLADAYDAQGVYTDAKAMPGLGFTIKAALGYTL